MGKAYTAYSIADILRLRPAWFMEKQTDVPEAQKFLQQLHTMIDYGMPHIAKYMFFDVFQDYNISVLPPTERNKRLHEYRKPKFSKEAFAPRATTLGFMPHDRLKKSVSIDLDVMKATMRNSEQQAESARKDVARRQSQIEEIYRAIEEQSRNVVVYEKQAEALKLGIAKGASIDTKRLNVIKSIPKDWVMVECETGSFTVARTTPIVIAISDSTSAVCDTLYLGFHWMKFSWSLDFLAAGPLADCIERPRYVEGGSDYSWHPHCKHKQFCWGNVKARQIELRAQQRWEDFWALLETVLSSYGSSPYITFEELQEMRVAFEEPDTYKSISPFIPTWFAGEKRDMLVREWAHTASEHYINDIARAFSPIDEAANLRLQRHKDRLAGKRPAFREPDFQRMLMELNKQVSVYRADVETKMRERYRNGVRGQLLKDLCTESGIKVPSRDMIVNFPYGSVDNATRLMLFAIYGEFWTSGAGNTRVFNYMGDGEQGCRLYFSSFQRANRWSFNHESDEWSDDDFGSWGVSMSISSTYQADHDTGQSDIDDCLPEHVSLEDFFNPKPPLLMRDKIKAKVPIATKKVAKKKPLDTAIAQLERQHRDAGGGIVWDESPATPPDVATWHPVPQMMAQRHESNLTATF